MWSFSFTALLSYILAGETCAEKLLTFSASPLTMPTRLLRSLRRTIAMSDTCSTTGTANPLIVVLVISTLLLEGTRILREKHLHDQGCTFPISDCSAQPADLRCGAMLIFSNRDAKLISRYTQKQTINVKKCFISCILILFYITETKHPETL